MSEQDQILVFDRRIVRLHRERAAANYADHDALLREVAAHITERLEDVSRGFPTVLSFGVPAEDIPKSMFVVAADISEKMLKRDWSVPLPLAVGVRGGQDDPSPAKTKDLPVGKSKFLRPPPQGGRGTVLDEEFLPFAPNSFDLILCTLNLHWVNDLPGALAQLKAALKPGGLFLAAILGGETLNELRSCLMDAELAVSGGASMRLSPQIDLQTATGLMQRAGFGLPVTDREFFTLTYENALALMRDLQGMGESNANRSRTKHFTRRAVLMEAARMYQERFTEDDRISATFEVIFMHGWKDGG